MQTQKELRKLSRAQLINVKRFLLDSEKRSVASIEMELESITLVSDKSKELEQFCQQFQVYDYILDVNLDKELYFVRNMPQGQRCFVTSQKGQTKIETEFGVKYQFESQLPGGSKSNRDGMCILDCILSATTLNILDIIVWGHQDFSEMIAEFRYWWIYGNVVYLLNKPLHTKQEFKFHWVDAYPMQMDKQLWEQNPSNRIGLAYIKKDSFYLCGFNPECFLYKDKKVDLGYDNTIQSIYDKGTIIMNLQLQDGWLKTIDGQLLGTCNSLESSIVQADIDVKTFEVRSIRKSSQYILEPFAKIKFWNRQI
ncbi:hypothetical protein pb186bvf_018424 [Paramecium bursaria]